MARKKLVTIDSYGKLEALGGLCGPITSPCYLDINVVIQLINAGKVVFEVNPVDIHDKTRLTYKNVLNHIYEYPAISHAKVITKNDINQVTDTDRHINDGGNQKVRTVQLDMFVSNKHG